MDMTGSATFDFATPVDLEVKVVDTELNGFVDNLTVVEENLFEVTRVKEVWVLGELRAAFVAGHFTDREAVALLMINGDAAYLERYGRLAPTRVGVHKTVSLYSYPIGRRVGVAGKFQWEGR